MTAVTPTRGSNKRLRDLQRAVHLVAGLLLVAYIYTPLRDLPIFGLLVQLAVVPAVVATGLAMWQLPRLRTWLRRRDRTLATTGAGSPTS